MNKPEYVDALGQALNIDSIVIKCGSPSKKVRLYRIIKIVGKKAVIAHLIRNEKSRNLTPNVSYDGEDVKCSIELENIIDVTKNITECGYSFSKVCYCN